MTLTFAGMEVDEDAVKLVFDGVKVQADDWIVVQAYEKPFINVMWIGIIVMLFGFGLAVLPPRRARCGSASAARQCKLRSEHWRMQSELGQAPLALGGTVRQGGGVYIGHTLPHRLMTRLTQEDQKRLRNARVVSVTLDSGHTIELPESLGHSFTSSLLEEDQAAKSKTAYAGGTRSTSRRDDCRISAIGVVRYVLRSRDRR